MDKKARILELIETLNKASKAYYDDGAEIISNFEYDAMYDELLALEAETGIVMANSPSRNVGYTVQSELPKERHPRRMLSLDKTKDRDELARWLGDHEGLLSWKLDGLTVVMTYENGVLAKAVTRGNGDIGEVITENARVFKNIPVTIPYKGRVVVRGEAVIKYKDFELINQAIDDADAKYKNPRNLCSGSVRQLNSKITAERSVHFYAFTLAEVDGLPGGHRSADNVTEAGTEAAGSTAGGSEGTAAGWDDGGSREAGMQFMADQGFEVVHYVKVNAQNIYDAINRYEAAIPDFEVPTDGLVLTFEDTNYAATLGETAKFPRDSIAFKWRDQQAETILREVEWSPSRTGLLNPVAVFDPVELEGTTVSRASVHNINIVEDFQLGIGDTITVYKANMIIPQLADNLTRSGNLEIPSVCPVCGGPTEIKQDAGTKTLVCINPDCLAKQVKRFSLFVSRDAMNIEGLSEQTLLKLIGKGVIRSLPDIYELGQHKDVIIDMEGYGEKSYNNLLESIENSRHTTPARILTSLGIPGVGVAMAAQIADACRNDWNKMVNLTREDLLEIDGVGDVMSRDYSEFFADEDNRAMVDRLTGMLDIDETYEDKGTALDGKVFVVTGSLNHYKSRKDLKTEIEAQGGKVTGSVTSKTDYLITNDPGSGTEKNRTARELGVPIITEDEIIEMLRGGN